MKVAYMKHLNGFLQWMGDSPVFENCNRSVKEVLTMRERNKYHIITFNFHRVPIIRFLVSKFLQLFLQKHFWKTCRQVKIQVFWRPEVYTVWGPLFKKRIQDHKCKIRYESEYLEGAYASEVP